MYFNQPHRDDNYCNIFQNSHCCFIKNFIVLVIGLKNDFNFTGIDYADVNNPLSE